MRIENGFNQGLRLVRRLVDAPASKNEDSKEVPIGISKRGRDVWAQANLDASLFLDPVLNYIIIDPYAHVFIESTLREVISSKAINTNKSPLYLPTEKSEDGKIIRNFEASIRSGNGQILFSEDYETNQEQIERLSLEISSKLLKIDDARPNENSYKTQLSFLCHKLNKIVAMSPLSPSHKPEQSPDGK